LASFTGAAVTHFVTINVDAVLAAIDASSGCSFASVVIIAASASIGKLVAVTFIACRGVIIIDVGLVITVTKGAASSSTTITDDGTANS
jgi:hypothetical protein